MKNSPPSVPGRLLLPVLCFVAASPTFHAAPSAPPPANPGSVDAQKTHTLYLGADFAVQWEGQLRPVQDVQGSTFIVAVNGKPTPVPSRLTDHQIKMDDALKISAGSVTITGFTAERAYTAANNPMRKLTEAIAISQLADANLDAAVSDLNEAQTRLGLAAASATDREGHPTPQVLDPGAVAGQFAAIESSGGAALNSNMGLASDMTTRGARESSGGNFDAFALSFEISAPQPLKKPYAIAVTRYRDQSEPGHSPRIWIYGESLARVDTTPRKIRLFRGGFPPGYKLEDVQLHLYDEGGEVATTVARKRLAITADEAFQFAVADYIGQHRGATLRPALVAKPSAAELRSKLTSEKLDRTFFVKVGKDGKPLGAYVDSSCAERLRDPDVQTVVEALRFNPALEQGKPVEGAVPVHLNLPTT